MVARRPRVRGPRRMVAMISISAALLAGCAPKTPVLKKISLPTSSRAGGSPTPGPSIYVPVSHSPNPQLPSPVIPSFDPGSPYVPPTGTTGPGGDNAENGSGGTSGTVQCGQTIDDSTKLSDITTQVECYDVSGSSPTQVEADINRTGPKVDGTHRIAATKWSIQWSFVSNDAGPGCVVENARAVTRIKQVYPRWKNMPPSYDGYWTGFMRRVEDHEDGHRDIAIATSDRVVRAIDRLGSYETCTAASKAGNHAANVQAQKGRDRQVQYDKNDRHL